MRIASNLYIKMATPVWPFSYNTGIKVTSAELASPAYVMRPLLWVRFFWENPKTDLWSQIIRILHYEKNGRSEKGSFTTSVHICCRHLHLLRTVFFFEKPLDKNTFFKSFPQKTIGFWISEIQIWICSEGSTLSVDFSDHIQGTPAELAQECLLSGYPVSEHLKKARVCLRKSFDRRP